MFQDPCTERLQQDTTFLAQQYWELMAHVAWCMQTNATTANIVVVPYKRARHCCATLRRSQNNRNVGTRCAKSSTGFKLYATSANIVVVPCKRTQHVGLNNVASVYMHGPLRPTQTDVTSRNIVGPNIVRNCWRLFALLAWCKRTQQLPTLLA